MVLSTPPSTWTIHAAACAPARRRSHGDLAPGWSLRSSRSSNVPQAASSLAMPPEPPAERAAARDRHMHGSDGRHQVATMPSTSSTKAPFAAPSAAMLSAHQLKHESDSTGCGGALSQMACSQVHAPVSVCRRASCRWCSVRPGSLGGARRVAPSTPAHSRTLTTGKFISTRYAR